MMAQEIWNQPLFGVAATLIAYRLAVRFQKRVPWMPAVLSASVALILFLLVLDIPYSSYKAGGDWITFLLGPATVALGVPLYKNTHRIKRHLGAILTGLTLGSVSSIVSAAAFVWLLGGTEDILLSILPKSTTSPVSIELVRKLGGIPELGASMTVLAGLMGNLIGPEFLKWCGVKEDTPIGVAIGTSSHGIGTSRLIARSQVQGGISGFAMAVNCIVTSLIIAPIVLWLR